MSEAELQQGINEMSLFFAQCQPQDWKELLTFEQNVFETIQQRLQGEDVEFPTVSASIRGLDEEETLITGLDPGEWNPPGNQPIRFYIGAEAHKGISRYYTVAHVGESVFTNFISISTILAEFKNRGFQVKFDRVTPTELGLQPDILNVSSREIYEIKSYRQESTALPQAKKYVGIFKKAGVNIKFGKKDDPGTYGMISAPGGYYIFGAPKDGVIIYRYQKKNPDEDPATAPQTAQEFLDAMSKATGLTGVALILYLVVSGSSRVIFPPRNVIPVP